MDSLISWAPDANKLDEPAIERNIDNIAYYLCIYEAE